MSDPTTRDPAASLARCIELVATADAMLCGDAMAWSEAHSRAERVTERFLRDDAPALLAEVEAAKRVAERMTEHVAYYQQRAEAAEQVARECLALLDNAAQWLKPHEHTPPERDTLHAELTTFLAHHGARTGDANV